MLNRQRMDFLLLLPRAVRIVIEIDGKQHYAEESAASPTRYAEMMRADRDLRFAVSAAKTQATSPHRRQPVCGSECSKGIHREILCRNDLAFQVLTKS